MNWLSASPGVVLTAYHPSGNNAVAGSNAKESEETVPSSRRSGQYTMNHDNSKKSTERPQMDRSSSQDSLDELSMDDYWKELENIHETSKNNHRDQEVVVVKEPDEGELEEEWLKEAGLSNLFGESTGDSLDSMVFLSTLTRTQTAAVQKRVETVSQTLRKKNKPYQVPDVRDIFRQQSDSKEKVSGESEPSSVTARENKNEAQDEVKDDPEFNLGISEKTTLPEDVPVSETDINLEISFAEQAANLKDSSIGKMCKGKEDDTLLPNFRLPKDKTGTTKIGDLAPQDMKKVYSLALIELTALYDLLGTEFKQQKAIKIKMKDSGLFGVPLSVLLEQDQKKVPGTRIPLIFHKLISQIEEARLDTEGLLRIPGVAARVKSLCQELEAKFYEGTFNWESVKQHDAASLLKLFIRELPQPLLTVEYLKAFQDVQNLPTKKHQLQALNLLVLLLPEANRDTLKILLEFLQRVIDHRDKNKMTLNNVAMVMAPNLFTFHGLGSKTIEQSEFVMAAGTANVMRFMIKYQKLLWTIPKFIVNQVRKQNTASQKKEKKDKAMKKLLKKMAYDKEKHEKQDKSPNDADVPQGVIRVQAPHLSKVSMAIQLTEELKASDIVARFLSQKSGVVQALKKEEVFLYEIGGNIGERCLDDDTYMKDLYQLNPNAEWVIKCKHS
ncbi:rho GTPase-activating protein 18 isoform X1 [Trachemys scripta elegans]|uniref:Rho GTPase-activating protein 18 n=2 Tax=Emydidae TaxID=8476 RepID=A0A8C3HZI4_CHRPI|nr:rho GTPase-activating protein 18 isoform X1 [Chrysemys picta bellii]XP_034621585.1 rho GTPase-activating protein 18 isoform X1 [Trachemys scripta elegans]XP_053878254.1 rho GTPase-activating protein 18 [Malaclemys terrapin pileata]